MANRFPILIAVRRSSCSWSIPRSSSSTRASRRSCCGSARSSTSRPSRASISRRRSRSSTPTACNMIENRLLRFDLDNIRVQVSGGKFYEVDAFIAYRISDPRRFRAAVSGRSNGRSAAADASRRGVAPCLRSARLRSGALGRACRDDASKCATSCSATPRRSASRSRMCASAGPI